MLILERHYSSYRLKHTFYIHDYCYLEEIVVLTTLKSIEYLDFRNSGDFPGLGPIAPVITRHFRHSPRNG